MTTALNQISKTSRAIIRSIESHYTAIEEPEALKSELTQLVSQVESRDNSDKLDSITIPSNTHPAPKIYASFGKHRSDFEIVNSWRNAIFVLNFLIAEHNKSLDLAKINAPQVTAPIVRAGVLGSIITGAARGAATGA